MKKPIEAPTQAPVIGRTAEYRIGNMDCPTEETLIRARLGKIEGVVKLEFNLMQRRDRKSVV